MKALVTGCAGFIGSHLTDRLLALGYEVTGIDSFTDYYSRKLKEANIASAMKSERFTMIERDLVTMGTYPKVDYVFHLAAQAGVRASWGQTFEIYVRNNIEATQKLLEFYKDAKPKKLVFASSSSVYGDAKLPMNEESLLKPVSPYGVTKLASENLCYLYWKNYRLPTVSLRYFTVYGPRVRPDMAINKFVRAISAGDEIPVFGDGSQTRDFTFVSDIVEGNILAATGDAAGEVLNLGGGNRISVKDLIGHMEEILGRSAKIRYEPAQKGDVLDTLADVYKARLMLGWKPQVPIRKGLEEYIRWWQQTGQQ
ncbi:MAG TPA: NAD-dependent epimerase/dehydratase family protein [Methanocella sp.]|jgi:UDP-glucose 4-epimerase